MNLGRRRRGRGTFLLGSSLGYVTKDLRCCLLPVGLGTVGLGTVLGVSFLAGC